MVGAAGSGTVVSKYDAAIDKGMELLDAKVPEWCKKMQLDHLHMGNGRSCVLGQLYGSYIRGSHQLDIWDEEADYGFEFADADKWPYDGYALRPKKRAS